ncbi:unnamed protein product [Peronospora belbahrii]|uniref:RxLR effector protein n=1 Tax=Peronospora belbahrii TaxID=622444 RepID=A0AAU9L0T7_9STRA|nr:unnamed protein product [Peronospora belbahrii]
MRKCYFFLLLLLAIVGCIEGFANNAKNQRDSDSIDNNGVKTKTTTTTAKDTEEEEEERFEIPGMPNLISYLKEKSSAIARFIENNPRVVKYVGGLKNEKDLTKSKTISGKSKGVAAPKEPGMIKSFFKRVRAMDVTGDLKGMIVAYCILFMATVAIVVIGFRVHQHSVSSANTLV